MLSGVEDTKESRAALFPSLTASTSQGYTNYPSSQATDRNSYTGTYGIEAGMSLFAAWSRMRETGTDTLCVTDEQDNLGGLIAVKDIANANLDIFDTEVIAESATSYANIVSTLNGEMLLGDPEPPSPKAASAWAPPPR